MCTSPLVLKNFTIIDARITYKVDWGSNSNERNAEAIIKVKVGEKDYYRVADGHHPLLAFSRALRSVLSSAYPTIIPPNLCMSPESKLTTEKEVAEALNALISQKL